MADKWQLLLAQLEVIESPLGQEIWTPAELQSFENKTGIILPAEYKKFCQVFGTGQLGTYMRIFCPNLNLSNAQLQGTKYIINNFTGLFSPRKIDIESLKNLLNFAFIFGGNPDADIVFWDLRTYSNSDKSCDIFLLNNGDIDVKFYKIGRDFYDFVCNFCLGMKGWKIIPKSKRPSPEVLARTFTPASLKWLTDNYPNLESWIN